MRIAIAQLWQESNTFNPLPTRRTDFEQFGVYRGAELVERMADTNELGGFIQSLRAWAERPEIVGLVRLPAWPSGRATAGTFRWIRDELVGSLRAAGQIDGLLLALHGAMVADEHPDVEGEVLAALRAEVGSAVPIVATLDLHANVTRQMVQHADALAAYHTMPHVDVFETGQRGAKVMYRILQGGRPVTAMQKIPAVVPAERSSTEAASGVAVDLKARVKQLESIPQVLTASLLPVQPWLDIPELGATVLVTTDNDPSLARQACADVAEEFWRRRQEYMPELWDVPDAVRRAAQECQEGLVVLSDPADATTSGAPGDSVWLLQELLQRDWPRPVLVTLVAPEIVRQATELGEGSRAEFALGGVRDTRFGTRVELDAEVERVFRAQFTLSGHLGRNLAIDMGLAVVLRRGAVRVVATTHSGPHFAPELFRAAGFDPFDAAVLVAKSPCGFRAVYESRARAIYSVRAPGCAPTDFWTYPYEQIDRPLWPWDEIGQWRVSPWVLNGSFV